MPHILVLLGHLKKKFPEQYFQGKDQGWKY